MRLAHRRSFALSLLALALAACGTPNQAAPISSSGTSIPYPSPGARTPTATPPPAGTPTATPILENSTATAVPTATATLTPEPTLRADILKLTPDRPITDLPTTGPDNPYYKEIWLEYPTTITKTITEAPLIVQGIVTEVGEARWTTPDGQRPSNPFAYDNIATIFRPVRLSVGTIHKGSFSGGEIVIYAFGGEVGQDQAVWRGDKRFAFDKGDEVIVFVEQYPFLPIINGEQLWNPYGRAVLADGLATGVGEPLPTQQFLDKIELLGGE